MQLIERLSWLKAKIQEELFPHLKECLNDPITEKQKRLVMILEVVEIERHIKGSWYQWMGRPLEDRQAIGRAFVAKSVYNHFTTRALIEALQGMPNLRRICGFQKKADIPSEATFSRAFKEFADSELGEKVHNALLREHLSEQLIGHVSKDSTAIEGNERPQNKGIDIKAAKEQGTKEQDKKKRGRPKKGEVKKGEVRTESKQESRIQRQEKQTAVEALRELPTWCDIGCKKNAQGHTEIWRGYKFHIDTTDSGLPITAVLTSASLHDSQVAIPMMKMTSGKITYLYDLMDAAYDAEPIYRVSRELGHVPIIDKNKRNGDIIPMSPAEKIRYNERTAAERTNSRLKEDFGGRNVKVRGAKKVTLHLMFGVIALFADQLLRLI